MNRPDSPLLVLASQSPRRRELLARLGVPFETVAAGVNENARTDETPPALVQRLARAKALAVAARFPERPVLAADTIVVLEGQVLGKPADQTEATEMLRRLRGRSHEVLSALFACHQASGREGATLNRSLVWMREYDEQEIAAYVASGDPMDKAGAYAIQNRAFAPVARVEGCFSGVMGFPLADAVQVLGQIGVATRTGVEAACSPYAGTCCQED